MPSGTTPSYAYTPPARIDSPHIRSCSSIRARLFAGGTYFRAREPGLHGNYLSVTVVEYSATDAVCVITNYAAAPSDLITGPGTLDLFDFQLNTNEAVELYELDKTPSRARKYSISFKIAPDAPAYTELGNIRTLALVSLPGMLVAKVTPPSLPFTTSDVIKITPRKRVYRLVSKTVTPPTVPDTGIAASDITADQIVDSVLGRAVKWIIRAELVSDLSRSCVTELLALSDGNNTADFTRYATTQLGAVIAGLTISADSDSGSLRLHVSSTFAVNITAQRILLQPLSGGTISVSTSDWDIDDLRAQVNANDPWLEMLPRSGPIPGPDLPGGGAGPMVPNPNPYDYMDLSPGSDAPALSPFAETRLVGGDGIPENPDREITGPLRSLVHVNYGEIYNGKLVEVNTVYEWNGINSKQGAWKNY